MQILITVTAVMLAVNLIIGLLMIFKLGGIMGVLDPILDKVTVIENRADSLITLVNGLAQLLRDNAADPAAITGIANRLQAQSDEIQAAIDANTPAPPPPPIP